MAIDQDKWFFGGDRIIPIKNTADCKLIFFGERRHKLAMTSTVEKILCPNTTNKYSLLALKNTQGSRL